MIVDVKDASFRAFHGEQFVVGGRSLQREEDCAINSRTMAHSPGQRRISPGSRQFVIDGSDVQQALVPMTLGCYPTRGTSGNRR